MKKVKNLFIHLWTNILTHKFYLMMYLLKFCIRLLWRGLVHDFSKLTPKEVNGFISNIDGLRNSEYGSEQYKKALEEIKPSIQEHYKRNRHHPEFYFEEGEEIDLSRMELIDLVEMFYDWQAAAKKHKDSARYKSLDINKKRFSISNDLYEILKKSIK